VSSSNSATGRREFLTALYAVLAIAVWDAVTVFIDYVIMPLVASQQVTRLTIAAAYVFGFLMSAGIVLGTIGYGLSRIAFSRRLPRIWLAIKVLLLVNIAMYIAAAVLFLIDIYMGWFP
jgi:hypothetical protein